MLFRMLAALLALAVVGFAAIAADEKQDEPKVVAKFAGSVDDDKAAVPKEPIITNEKDLEALWKAWKIDDRMPQVDFKKELVIISTAKGSKLSVKLKLDKGDLTITPSATKDLRPGLRYAIQVVEREGIKKVNGKELKD